MGLDLYLQHPKCPTCNHEPEYAYEGAYTYNVSPMWYAIYPDTKNMIPIEGMTGKEAEPLLHDAVYRLINSRRVLERLNPDNGFGSYEGFLKFLRDVLAASQDYPDLIWRAWR